LKPNYGAEKRRKELDRKKKKEEKEQKKKERREAIARGEISQEEADAADAAEYLAMNAPEDSDPEES
jgi:hypothetical protein